MHSTPLRWLAVLGLLSCAVATAQDPAIQAIDACLATLEVSGQKVAPGVEDIETQCPELKTVLEHSPYAAWFPEEWWNPQLSTGSLAELRDHAELASTTREARTLDTSGVAGVLESLEDDRRASQVTWWDRLLQWLRSRFKPDAEEPPTWLFKWLEELSRHETALRVTGYVLFGLVILSAVWIVINELRAAGVFGAHAQRHARSMGPQGSARAAGELTLADIESSDPLNRPSMLLALLLAALARREDRAVDSSTTHRELAARVTLDDSSQRLAFGRLVRCAERVRYAATLPARSEIDEVVGEARHLLDLIAVSAGTSPA